MANRTKRLEKERTALKSRQNLRVRFRKEKKIRKEGVVRPFLNTVLQTKSILSLKGLPTKPFLKDMLGLKKRHRNEYDVFVKILGHPKLLFSNISYYWKLMKAFFSVPVVRSLETWKMPKSKNENVLFFSLFCHLLAKYRIPKSIETVIFEHGIGHLYIDEEILKFVYQILKGQGIHHRSLSVDWKMGVVLNGKMNYYFNNAPASLCIPKALWFAKIRSMAIPYSRTMQLISSLEIDYSSQWKSWHNDLIFFLNGNEEKSQKDLKKIVDFVILQKKGKVYLPVHGFEEEAWIPVLYPDFSLKGRTIASVLRYVDKWRSYVKNIEQKGMAEPFKTSSIQPIRKRKGKTRLIIRQITSLLDLYKEGANMDHCVASYADECLTGASSIWVLRQILSNGKMKRMLTIEVRETDKTMTQAHGKSNRNPRAHEVAILSEWGQRENLKYKFLKSGALR